jgi:Protein of unknown function, DUF547
MRRLGVLVALVLCFADTAAAGATSPKPAGASRQVPAMSREPDYSGYQKLLNQYVSVIESKPLTTRFDYVKFYKDTTRTARCAKIHAALTEVDPNAMDRSTRTAWAINTYNFLILEATTAFLWHRVFRGWEKVYSVSEIKSGQGTFFRRIACTVDSVSYSLDDFERHFLFYDHAKRDTLPPDSLDPRAHFAIVCGAIGCPALQPRVYRADSLDRQLDAATRETLANPAHLKWDPATNVLEASEIFEWFPGDFGGPKGELKFIRRYAPKDIATAIDKGKITGITRYIPWDWKLNQTP